MMLMKDFVDLWLVKLLIFWMDSLLCWVMMPRHPTSRGTKSTEKPAALMSLTNDEYLLVFSSLEVWRRSSQGTVSSMMVIKGNDGDVFC